MEKSATLLSDFILDIPCANELGVSAEETAKYEALLLVFHEHQFREDEKTYARPLVTFLKNIENPPECVLSFLKMLEDAQFDVEHNIGSVSDLDLESEKPYQVSNDAGESFVEVDLGSESASGYHSQEDNFNPNLKLSSAPYYTPDRTDFTIFANSGSDSTVFNVHSHYMKAHSAWFKKMFKDGKFGDPGSRYTYSTEADPTAMDYLLAFFYGTPVEFPDREAVGPLIPFTRNLVKLAIDHRLHKLVKDITEELGKSLLTRAWPPDIMPTLMDLYSFYKLYLQGGEYGGIKITVPQLVGWVRNLQKAGKIRILKRFIGINKNPEKYAGSGDFLRDLSIALCRVLHDTLDEGGPSVDDAATPKSDSAILVDFADIPDETHEMPGLKKI